MTFAADSKAVFNAWGLFNGCSKLNKVTLPPGLTKIPGYAFQNCTVLTSLTIPATVTTIEVSAFNSCLANLVLRFDGNAPTRGNDAIPAGTTIAYWDGKTGFTEPDWQGYSLKLRNISLTQTNVTINSASFSFAPQTGATAVLQQKADGGDWELAATAPLDENSAAVTATGLVPGKSYDFRLQISGGDNAGPSTVVSLTTKVAVTGISLDKVSMELLQNNSETITASVEPGDAANKDLIWTSSNETVATVDGAGLVSAKSAGTATITATAADGSGSRADCLVTVFPYSVTISGEQVTIKTYLGNAASVTIPDTIGGKTVVAIGNQAFYNKQTLTEVSIPASVTSIGYGAFHEC